MARKIWTWVRSCRPGSSRPTAKTHHKRFLGYRSALRRDFREISDGWRKKSRIVTWRSSAAIASRRKPIALNRDFTRVELKSSWRCQGSGIALLNWRKIGVTTASYFRNSWQTGIERIAKVVYPSPRERWTWPSQRRAIRTRASYKTGASTIFHSLTTTSIQDLAVCWRLSSLHRRSLMPMRMRRKDIWAHGHI